MHDDPTVAALVAGARQGDQRCWYGLVERYAPLVWAVCRRFGLSDADAHDAGQTVWLRLVEHLPQLREPAALPGWLVTTTRRECLRVLRGARDSAGRLQPDEAAIAADAESTAVDRWVIAEERAAALRVGFAQLPRHCQELLSLLMADPVVPYAEISAKLDMPIGSIGPKRARCLQDLRRRPVIQRLIDGESDKG